MRGVWLGLLGLNLFMFVINMDAFAADTVTIYYPILNIASAYICWYMARG